MHLPLEERFDEGEVNTLLNMVHKANVTNILDLGYKVQAILYAMDEHEQNHSGERYVVFEHTAVHIAIVFIFIFMFIHCTHKDFYTCMNKFKIYCTTY